MIGSSELDVDGITGAGRAEPLMRGGEWAAPPAAVTPAAVSSS
jgi:hypothetical protein